MRKQRKRLYAALLCICMVLSLVSTPVSAAETGQMTNTQEHAAEFYSQESVSGNEASSVSENVATATLNGLSVAVLAANSVAEVTTAAELTAALENSANDTVKLMADITIDTTLVVSHTVTLDLNGHILKYENNTVQGSVITVGSGGVLTIQDSDATASHHFTPDGNGLWVLDEVNGTENVSGGIITGGDAPYGGGVYIHDGGKLTMQGGNIVGCKVGGSEGSGGGGVCIKGGTFRMMRGSIIGCLVDIYFAYGGGVWLEGSSSEFIMEGGSIEHCAVNSLTQGYGGGVCATGVAGDLSEGARFTMTGGSITECSVSGHLSGNGGGVGITPELGGRPVFTMSGSAFIGSNTAQTVHYFNLLSGDNICIKGGIMHANGGTVAASPAGSNNCSMYNYSSGLITGGSSETTIFKGYVVNCSYATISGGKFMDTVLNDGYSCIISGGEFYGAVTNKGTINNGVFYGLVTNTGTINGGSFATLPASDGSTWYPVTFEWNDGTAKTENRHVMENTTVTPPAPARTGYRLAYWYQTDENTAFDFDTPVTRKMTLKAKWARLYAIDVLTEGQGTAQASPTSAAAGDKVTLSVTPHEGYCLKEWAINPDTLSIGDDNTFTMPEGPVTVKAVFEGIPYSVTLQTNGGTIAQGKEITSYTYGTGATLPTANDITRDGYTFHGWYADSSFSGSPITEIADTETGEKTFYAKWTPNTINYIVEHYKTDCSGYTLVETEHSAGKTGDTVTATPKTYDGFTYNAVISTASGTLKKISRPEDIVILKLYYDVSVYTVILDTNGGTIAQGKEVTGYTHGAGATLPTASDMTRDGYTFHGWYADSSFSGSPVTEITGTDTGNKTFYAKWTQNTTPVIPSSTVRYIVEHYKADGSGYALAETEHSAGSIGDTVTATPKVYEGFTYNPAISTASGTLKKISSPEDIVTLKLYYDVNADTKQESSDSGSEEKADREDPSPVVKNTPSYVTYTVQAGDTLWAIARKYGCSIAEIVTANSDRIKNPNRIHAGWQLKIPRSGATVTGSTPDAVLPENKKSGTYIVGQGDTLWAIARKCGCSVAEIVSLNRELIRNPSLIYPGWQLKVPQN